MHVINVISRDSYFPISDQPGKTAAGASSTIYMELDCNIQVDIDTDILPGGHFTVIITGCRLEDVANDHVCQVVSKAKHIWVAQRLQDEGQLKIEKIQLIWELLKKTQSSLFCSLSPHKKKKLL